MDLEFIIRESEEEPRRLPPAVNLTGWETIVFEIADEDDSDGE